MGDTEPGGRETMATDNAIQSQQQAPQPGPEHKRLQVFIGRWINEGYTIAETGSPSVKITTSDVYEWMPGGFFVLHTAYGRIGNMDVGGTEVLGYDHRTGKHFSRFYDSRGNVSDAELTVDGDTWTWKGETTGCTAVFTENGKMQTAHHVRLDVNGDWVPAMEVVLIKNA
jgi:Protein of unknown function (DUF1579)